MKKLKNYFKMLITAVICFAMSLIPQKRGQVGVIGKVLAEGQAVSNYTVNRTNNQNNSKNVFGTSNAGIKYKRSGRGCLPVEKCFYWMQGPGDRRYGVIYDTG